MTSVAIILFLACIPICRAITVSGKAGFHGCIGKAIWMLDGIEREAAILAGALRKFHAARAEMRARWTAQEARP